MTRIYEVSHITDPSWLQRGRCGATGFIQLHAHIGLLRQAPTLISKVTLATHILHWCGHLAAKVPKVVIRLNSPVLIKSAAPDLYKKTLPVFIITSIVFILYPLH